MDGDKNDTFIVTQFINPNYFILFNPYLRDDKKLKEIESCLEEEIKIYGQGSSIKSFNKGDIVAFYWTEQKHYIRCEVDDVKEFNSIMHYFLFALDYGVSLYTTNIHDIYGVSELMKFQKTPIMDKVSLPILPAITRFDYLQDKEVINFHNTWCDLALKLFHKTLNNASVIKFEISNDLPGYNGYLFGDLIVTSFYGITISLVETLLEAKVAKRASSPQEFLKYFDKLNRFERWNDNSRTGGILKYGENKLPCYYEDEILMKKYIAKCEAIQCRMMSVQKVLDWKEKNDGLAEAVSPMDSASEMSVDWDSTAGGSNSMVDVDEGFDETISSKRKIMFLSISDHSKFGTQKKPKIDDHEEKSIISGISQSISQMAPR